ncbi:hypothetical protein QM012_006692 [Aureobasidium pullulans]|uniref:CBM-cenC domain-containing protein n=1 Tax=Aureobasidium pullulans TaxID=5580 RepID=A0ABR0TPM1_AURPU
MHIPTVQSLLCLSLLALPYASAVPLDANLQPRVTTTCNANDIKTVNSSNKQPVAYCKSWLASKQSKSTVKGLTVAQVSNACKCVQASASSSSAAAKKTTSTTKKSSSTTKVTSSAKKVTSSATTKATTSIKTSLKEVSISTRASSSTKTSTSSKKTSTSSKQSSTSKQSTSSKSSTSQKPTATSTSVASKKSTSTSASTKQSSSSSGKTSSKPTSAAKSSSSASISSTSTQSHHSSSASSTTSSVSSATFSADAIPMDPVTGVVANQKAPTGVSTRSSSSIQTSSSTIASSATTAASANTKDLSNGSNVITNGIFGQGSTTGWHGAEAFGTKFAVASLAGDSNYEALVKYALAAGDNASGQLYQNVTIPANSAWQLSANVFLNYPSGLPAGISCVVKYSLGSDSIVLKQYGVASTSGSILSDTASGQLSQAFTGRFMIDTYCNSASSSAASFALGFGNIQLLVADAGSATSSAATTNAAVAASTSSPSSTTSSAASASTTGANMLTNGDFNTGDFSGWALYRLGTPTFAIQGNPNAYVSVITFPAGGSYNSQAALLQQSATAQSGKTYTASLGLLLNYPSGLANDGSACSVQVYLVDSNGFGVSFASTTYGYGDAAYQSITGSGTVNNGFTGVFDIMIRCYGGAQAIVAGVEDVQLFES